MPKEIIARLVEVHMQPGYFYFLRGSDVYALRMNLAGADNKKDPQKVGTFNFQVEKGYSYDLDMKGNVTRTRKSI